MRCPTKMDSDSVTVIAEIGTSHNGSLSRAEKLIQAAASAGADCVKTQIVFAEEIIHPNTGMVRLPGGQIRLYDRFKDLEQDFSFYCRVQEMCSASGMEFLASPFGDKSLDWLLRLDIESIKIASPELNHFPLLERAAASGRKLILSTGVSELSDIEAALNTIASAAPADAPAPVLLHCITAYPAPGEEYNLRLLETLAKRYSIEVGVSDHSRDPLLIPSVSVAAGAKYIEKHITLGHGDGGLDDPIALTPEQFKEMTAAVRRTEQLPQQKRLPDVRSRLGTAAVDKVLGDGVKRLAPSEAANYGRTNRSIHAVTSLAAGTVLTRDNTALLRTEKELRPGLRPEFWDQILGKRLIRNIESGEGITDEDINSAD